jgi:hypothetical protein
MDGDVQNRFAVIGGWGSEIRLGKFETRKQDLRFAMGNGLSAVFSERVVGKKTGRWGVPLARGESRPEEARASEDRRVVWGDRAHGT